MRNGKEPITIINLTEESTMSAEHKNDNVNHPSHYTSGEIEVIDYIRDKLGCTEFTGYCIGNVIKYISRWRLKGGVEDLKKAEVYLSWAIQSANVETNKCESELGYSEC